MDSALISKLEIYGFTDKESRVYLTCLELGSSLASTIARRAEVNRGTTYSILEDFKRKGIATEHMRKELKYFSVVNPELLFRKEEARYEKMKMGLPGLLAVVDTLGNRPKAQFYEGLEGIKKVFEDLLRAGKKMTTPYLCFVGTDTMDDRVGEYLTKTFIPQRMKLPLKTKAILSLDVSPYIEYHKKNHSVLVIKSPTFDLGNEIVVYGENKVAIMMYETGEVSGMIIESNTLHKGLLNLFNLIWDTNKKKQIGKLKRKSRK